MTATSCVSTLRRIRNLITECSNSGHTDMHFAIIAAGKGERLAAGGATLPKPLVNLGGMPMIERLVRMFMECGARDVSVIINPLQAETVCFMRGLQRKLPVNLVIRETPSPMHSLLELAPYIEGEPFCATTVDTVFSRESLTAVIRMMQEGRADGIMGVTDYVSDEKPLFVNVDADMHIRGFLDSSDECRYVSAGVYCLPPSAIGVLAGAVQSGEKRMRHFQRMLLESGMRLDACDMGRVIDVDCMGDLEEAQRFVNSGI